MRSSGHDAVHYDFNRPRSFSVDLKDESRLDEVLFRMRQSQPVETKTKSATFKRDSTGNWDMTLVTNFNPAPPPADPPRVIGSTWD